MRRPSIAFEWQELDEGQELPPNMTSDQAPRASHAAEEQRLLLGGAALLLVAALLVTPWVMGQAQRELAQAHDELARAVEVETRPEREATVSASARQESAATHQSHERVISLETQVFQHDVAAVLVRTQTDAGGDGLPTVYRQMRFYRQTEQSWQPTEPTPFLWGQPQHLATRHFEFTYRSRDAQAVQAVAADLDALYEQVRRNFGLSPAPDGAQIISDALYRSVHSSLGLSSAPDRKLTIEVVVEKPGDRQMYARREQITVFSPALLRAPESLTDAAILRQSILLHLVDKAISEAASTHRVSLSSYPLLSAMRLWQAWNLGGPLAASREPLLRWLSGDPQWMDDASPLSPRYAELCALDSLWKDTLLQTPVPLLCSGMDKATLDSWDLFSSRRTIEFKDLIRIPPYPFHMTDYRSELPDPPSQFEPILTAALLDYIAATYGPKQIGALWPLLRESKGWATSIPAVFGVSVEEFEAGWQAYLAEMLDD